MPPLLVAVRSARLSQVALALAIATAIAGCSRPAEPTGSDDAKTATASTAATVPGKGEGLEGRLDIVAWPGYIERGATDKRYDWVTSFEQDTGCKVKVKAAGTADEMVSLMAQGGHDLVTAPGDAALRMIRAGAVQPVDLQRIPSYANVDERLQQAPWHFVAGKHYGVPFQWGPNVLLYSTRVFGSAPSSWSVVFDEQRLPDGKSNKGRVQAHGDPLYIADAALYLMARKPELGITDPYALSEEQYAAVLELLRTQRPLLQRYWRDAIVQVQDFASGGVAAASSRGFQVNTLRANGQPVASVIPSEGATGWADTTLLATKAPHPNCAYKWLEWSLNATVQGDVAAWFGSVPAVPVACRGNTLLTDTGCQANGAEAYDRIRFARTPESTCAAGACVPYERWVQDYAAIMGGG